MPSSFLIDPDAVLDYRFDWSQWLTAGEVIQDHTVTAITDGITVDSSDPTDTDVTAWLSGAAISTTQRVTCHIVTDQGREDDRTITLQVRNR